MAIDYAQLKVDDAAGHPTTGAFNASASIAATEWNALNRDAPADIAAMFAYFVTERTQTGQGSDTVATSLLGRLHNVAAADVGSDPFARGTASGQVKLEEKHAANMLLQLLLTVGRGVEVLTTDTEFEAALDTLVGNANAAVMKSGDKTAILALTQSQRSYAAEKGYPVLTTGDIEIARALP